MFQIVSNVSILEKCSAGESSAELAGGKGRKVLSLRGEKLASDWFKSLSGLNRDTARW